MLRPSAPRCSRRECKGSWFGVEFGSGIQRPERRNQADFCWLLRDELCVLFAELDTGLFAGAGKFPGERARPQSDRGDALVKPGRSGSIASEAEATRKIFPAHCATNAPRAFHAGFSQIGCITVRHRKASRSRFTAPAGSSGNGFLYGRKPGAVPSGRRRERSSARRRRSSGDNRAIAAATSSSARLRSSSRSFNDSRDTAR
jgi:hypothetical protein